MVSNDSADREEQTQEAIDRFWEIFPVIWDHIRKHVRSIATDQYGISVEQFRILRLIRRGQASVSAIADEKQISRSAVSQGVEALIEKGLVSQRQIDADRRCHELELTEKGGNLLNSIFKENRLWMMEQMESLDAGDALSIVQGLETLKKTFIKS